MVRSCQQPASRPPRHAGRLALVVGLLGALLILPAAPAAAGTVTLTVSKSGVAQGTVTDSLMQVNCGQDCSGDYVEFCEVIIPGVTVCDAVEVTLTTDVPVGFSAAWTSGCDTTTSTTCTVSAGGGSTDFNRSASVAVTYTDVTPPGVDLTGPAVNGAYRDAVPATANALDNDVIARVDFVLTRVGGGATQTVSDTTAPFAGSHDVSGMADGAYTVTARAFDRSGLQSTPSTRQVTVDHVAPVLTVTGPGSASTPGPSYATASHDWTITASDATSGVALLTCSLNGAAPAPCSGGAETHSVEGLVDGVHELVVTATDKAGNVAAATRHFSVDTVAPGTSITSGPPRPFSVSSSAAFRHTADETATFTCALDGAAAKACAATKTYSGLRAGSHTARVRAVDRANNVDATPASWTWTVPHDDRALRHGQAWTEARGKGYWRSTLLATTTQQAQLTRASVRARRLALVVATCPKCGTVDVFHGRTRLKRVSLVSATTQLRHIVPLKTYGALSPARDVRIVVVSRAKPVRIDGIAIATR